MKELIKVSEVKIGDTIDMLVGYTITVTDIKLCQVNKWSTPYYEFTSISNLSDDKKEYIRKFRINDYVHIIGRDFEYEPEIKLFKRW